MRCRKHSNSDILCLKVNDRSLFELIGSLFRVRKLKWPTRFPHLYSHSNYWIILRRLNWGDLVWGKSAWVLKCQFIPWTTTGNLIWLNCLATRGKPKILHMSNKMYNVYSYQNSFTGRWLWYFNVSYIQYSYRNYHFQYWPVSRTENGTE